MLKKLLDKTKNGFLNGPGHRLGGETANKEQESDHSLRAREVPVAAMSRLTLAAGTSLSQVKSSESAENKYLAVNGIYFKCPIIGPGILPMSAWQDEIKKHFQQKLKENPGPTACSIIHTLNSDKRKVGICIETLTKYMQNLISEPDNEKFQKIRLSNRTFQEKVANIDGSLEFLLAAGFEIQKLPFDEGEEDFLVMSPTKMSVQNWSTLVDTLTKSKPIEPELDRNVQVLLAAEATNRVQLPPEFFILTPKEIKREQELRTQNVQKAMLLRTRAMKEKDEIRQVRKYNYCIIRVRFPDGLILQGTFRVGDKLLAVKHMVQESLKDHGKFSLHRSLGKELSEDENDSTLLQLNLVPATVITFMWGEKRKPRQYLKDELLDSVQKL